MIQSSYIHRIKGRLRVNVSCIKRNSQLAAQLERHLLSVEGLRQVIANPVTGNVLIHYDDERVWDGDLLNWLCQERYVAPRHEGFSEHPSTQCLPINAEMAKTLLLSTIEVLFQRALVALI